MKQVFVLSPVIIDDGVEEKNAVIYDHTHKGQLQLVLSYGITRQCFYCDEDCCEIVLWLTGADSWVDVVGRGLRVRATAKRCIAIGHLTDDVWFYSNKPILCYPAGDPVAGAAPDAGAGAASDIDPENGSDSKR